jgi:ubiquinone/menaquinone biosynthesis C-methylase UbiE
MILDVGCGDNPQGDININLWHIEGVNRLVLGDAQKLPFTNSSVDNVICSHLLEHCKNPNFVLNEMRRILKGNGKALIKVPNSRGLLDCFDDTHIYSWDLPTFYRFLHIYFKRVQIYPYLRISKLPMTKHYFFLRLVFFIGYALTLQPDELVAVCRK